jgi:hypothetical protein
MGAYLIVFESRKPGSSLATSIHMSADEVDGEVQLVNFSRYAEFEDGLRVFLAADLSEEPEEKVSLNEAKQLEKLTTIVCCCVILM